MASRLECDEMYQSIGFDKYDSMIPRRVIESILNASALQTSARQKIMRCAVMAEIFDMEEYFEISEYATSDPARQVLDDPSKIRGVYIFRPGTNQQRPMELWLIPNGGYTYRKYMTASNYKTLSLRRLRQNINLMIRMKSQISNLPEDIIDQIFLAGEGFVIIPNKNSPVSPETEPWHEIYEFKGSWDLFAKEMFDAFVTQPWKRYWKL